jgi:hypothetical protein
MLGRNYRIIFFLFATATLLACVIPGLAPVSAPIPTFDPNSINTSIAATAGAAASQTAAFLPLTLTPTVTSLPTQTASITPTPTATFVFQINTPAGQDSTPGTPTSGTAEAAKEYACELVTQAPEDNSTLAPRIDFEVRWQVKNTGTLTWDSNNIDYRYASGDKLHTSSGIYDMYKNIPPQEMADIIVKMRSPGDPGTYSTVWKIRIGKTEFCKLSLTIVVK